MHCCERHPSLPILLLLLLQVNPRFTEDVMPLVDPEKGAILYCAVGGSLEGATDANNKVKALQSRCGLFNWQGPMRCCH